MGAGCRRNHINVIVCAYLDDHFADWRFRNTRIKRLSWCIDGGHDDGKPFLSDMVC
jgi:hypothetical protein